MNILMLLYKDIHYDARVKREALALAEAGHFVYISCVKEYKEPAPFLHKNIKLLHVAISVKSMKASITQQEMKSSKKSILKSTLVWTVRRPVIKIIKDYLAYYEYYKKVKVLVKNLEIDVIHCHDLNTLWQGSMLSEDLLAKLIYDSHEIFNEMAGRNKLDRIVGYRMEKQLFRKVDYVVTVNSYLRDYLFERNGEKPSILIQNIPLVNEQQMSKTEVPATWNYNFGQDDVILLYQGGFSPYRGLELIIQSMEKLPKNYKLVLIGSGVLKDELEELVRTLNLSEKVFFHDQVPSDELIYYTRQAHIGLVMYEKVSKNNYYSTPNKIFEYIQAGIPAVSSNHPGKSVIIDEYKTGVLAEETVDGIVKGINEVVNNYRYYQQNCLNAQKVLTWEDESKKLIELYQGLVR
ncbi:glycosyltransferase [Metabacillus rhizolycopersici]|uniref:Glycosyltransferase n=1 Tax=Metabacillus rhizolycopersici TaxID=2875709 RepID=A0ABS7US78_9BACI|nr:glycosyltransferase [Metabacillus rhizolycopersici]MBZ5750843.1 glycosyltransferase [Metabacillus rhizolycopersici]